MTDEKAQGVPLSPYMQRREAEEKARAAAEDEYRDSERRILTEFEASVSRVREKSVGGAQSLGNTPPPSDPLLSALHGYEKALSLFGVMPSRVLEEARRVAMSEYSRAVARANTNLAESKTETPDNPGQPRYPSEYRPSGGVMAGHGGTVLMVDADGKAWWVDVEGKIITPALVSEGR